MAGIKPTTKVNASSLFETIVALMVIVLVFGIAMTMYVNILRTSSSLAELKAAQRLEALAKETKEKRSYFDEYFEEDAFVIEKRVGKYMDREGVLLLNFEAFDKSKKRLAERKEIIIDNTND